MVNNFEIENQFHWNIDQSRWAKFLSQYEVFKLSVPYGDIVECGVFKGCSLIRLAAYRDMHKRNNSKLIGFDIFGDFPDDLDEKDDREERDKFVEVSGGKSFPKNALEAILMTNGVENFELVKGDVCKTVPEYVKSNNAFRISLLHMDLDLYKPSLVALKCLMPRVLKGGVIIFDNYGHFKGERTAVDEYFGEKKKELQPFPFGGSLENSPSFYIKND